jgi:tetratricopeptide (TPR) repeat protein
MKAAAITPLRPVIRWTLVVCLAVALAPWLSGGQQPLALLLSAGAMLLGSLLLWRQPSVRQLLPGPLVWAYVALLCWAGLSLLWTASRYSTLVWLVMLALAGFVFRLGYVLAGEVQGRRDVLAAYLVSAAAFAAYGYWLYLTDGYDRLTGSFYWANPAAAYLIPAILVSLHGLRQPGRRRWLWLSAAVWFGAAFALTDSRAATLVLALLLGVYALVVSGLKRYWITLVFTGLSVILLSNGLVQVRHWLQPEAGTTALGSRFAEAATGESRSGSDRIQYLVSAGDMWWAHPVLGVGAGAYGDAHPQYQHRVVSAATNAHNFYVQTLAELGLVGALALAWLLLVLLIGVLRGLLQRPAWPEAIPWLLGALGLLLHSGLDIDSRYPAIVLLTAAMLGLLYTQARSLRHQTPWSLPLWALVLTLPVASLYVSSDWAGRAQAAQADGDYEQAATQYDWASASVMANPDWRSAEGINLYALASGRPDHPGEQRRLADLALSAALTAQKLDPLDAQHHQLEGRVRQLQGDLAGAEAAYRRALVLDPLNHPDYAWDLATLQQRQGRLDEAQATAAVMLDRYPDDVIANRSNDPTVRPAVANLWALVGNIELAQGRLTEARGAVGRALTIDGQNLRGRALKHQLDLRSY